MISKGLLIAVLLFALVVGTVALDTLLCVRAIDGLLEALSHIPAEDPATAADAAEHFRTEWEARRVLLVLSLPRAHAADVEAELSDLTGAILAEDTANIRMALSNMEEILSHMRRTALPSLAYVL